MILLIRSQQMWLPELQGYNSHIPQMDLAIALWVIITDHIYIP